MVHHIPNWDGSPQSGTTTWIEPSVKSGEQQKLDTLLRFGMSEDEVRSSLSLGSVPAEQLRSELHVGAGLVFSTLASPHFPDADVQLVFILSPMHVTGEPRLGCWGFVEKRKPGPYDWLTMR